MDYIESFGAILSPKDVRDYKAACTAAANAFPTEFELEMPAVKNQGTVGACVAHSLATTIEYFNHHQGDGTDEMSVGFIYGNRGTYDYDGVGMIVRQALDRVQKCGSVTKKQCSTYAEVPGIITHVQGQLANYLPDAYPNRITSYYRLDTDDAIKASLMQNGPVVFAMNWFSDIRLVDGVLVTEQVRSNSAHAMVIYGWNETGWKIQNSWGAHWGNNGRAILPYNIERSETWGIVDTYSENLRKKQEEASNARIAELLAKANEQEEEIERLIHLIDSFESDDETQAKELVRLNEHLTKLSEEYNANQQKLQEYQNEIDLLNQQLVDIKKPFQSSLGKLIAKVLNLILQLVAKKQM